MSVTVAMTLDVKGLSPKEEWTAIRNEDLMSSPWELGSPVLFC